jgi:hypothetical protein
MTIKTVIFHEHASSARYIKRSLMKTDKGKGMI